ncbi:dipeptide/oligopeptide/nickel ABC transporter permease/ATP-binding protein [Propioniciclava soli]|uniref:Dipeptide/oligopeptide/nickel ABC transporter permease/ATP-binding protein n=1 Tax=Propioniciclava soli TaxID=2775081 RepID=A0ABZ3C9S3_9ACTN
MSDTKPTMPIPVTKRSQGLLRRVMKNPVGLVSLGFILLIFGLALFGGLLAPHDPNLSDARLILAPASADHPLGTDPSGRDVLSRLLVATQISLFAATLALVVALVIGVLAGLVAGYYKGWIDGVFGWITALTMAMPGIIILLAARTIIGPSVWLAMLVFGVLMSPSFYRLVYASVSAVREELYVDAARVSGLSDGRIISRHILGVVRAPIIIQSAMILGIAVAIQSGLEFLGLGDTRVPTWGGMLSDGFAAMYRAPILMLWPSLAIGLTSIALTLFANVLRDELERSGGILRRRKKGAQAAEKRSRQGDPVLVHGEDAHSARRTGEVLLDVSNLHVGYDQPDGSLVEVVRGVDLTIRRGEVHGLIGESGSGKSQTSFAILGLLPSGGRVVDGSVVFEGVQLANADADAYATVRGTRMAYIPQEPMSNLDPMFTIGSQLTEPLRKTQGMDKKAATKKALALLARVGIPDPQRTFDAYPHQISGGMAQRVLIAGAVSSDPDLLIADEPTTALDVTIQAEVLDLTRDLQQDYDMAVLLVTHNFGVVADLCDRVSVMREGKIIETGPVRGIFADPQHAYTQSLLDAMLEDSAPRPPLTQGARS